MNEAEIRRVAADAGREAVKDLVERAYQLRDSLRWALKKISLLERQGEDYERAVRLGRERIAE